MGTALEAAIETQVMADDIPSHAEEVTVTPLVVQPSAPVRQEFRYPRNMGTSGLPELPSPNFREEWSLSRKPLERFVFLASLRLLHGLYCQGCQMSIEVGGLSRHLHSARHRQACWVLLHYRHGQPSPPMPDLPPTAG